jgi:hypothetical protein
MVCETGVTGGMKVREERDRSEEHTADLILYNVTDVSECALPFGTFEFERLHAFGCVHLALKKLQAAAITGRCIAPELQQRCG